MNRQFLVAAVACVLAGFVSETVAQVDVEVRVSRRNSDPLCYDPKNPLPDHAYFYFGEGEYMPITVDYCTNEIRIRSVSVQNPVDIGWVRIAGNAPPSLLVSINHAGFFGPLTAAGVDFDGMEVVGAALRDSTSF